MAEQIISPGVFTRENDQSFLPAGVGAIGAAVVGPTVKGPAFTPTIVNSFSEYENIFGPMTNETFVPHTVANYLRSAGTVTVVRVLAGGGYTYTNSSTEAVAVVAQTHATCIDCLDTDGLAAASADASFTITLPAAQGGDGGTSATTILFDDSETTNPLEGSNTIAIGIGSVADTVIRNYLIAAINGDQTSSLGVNVDLASGGVGQAGVLGVEAFPGSADTKVSLRTVLAGSGSNAGGTILATASGVNIVDGTKFSGGKDILLGIIKPSKALSTPDLSLSVMQSGSNNGGQAIASGSFSVILKGLTGGSSATSGKTYSCSLNPSNQDYLFTQINDNPNNSKTAVDAYDGDPGFAYINFEAIQKQFHASGSMVGNDLGNYLIGSGSRINFMNQSANIVYSGVNLGSQTEGYSYASTPWIKSQFVDANKTTRQLFKVHTLAHGTSCNKDYKVSIANQLTPGDIDGVPQYTTFSLILRNYDDTDNGQTPVAAWNNLTLDPTSTNYIARVIGDRYP
jgi:hypothetical protein